MVRFLKLQRQGCVQSVYTFALAPTTTLPVQPHLPMTHRSPTPPASQAIALALQRAIVGRHLQPGTKLAEQTLATHFGVSRTLVRQALIELAQHKWVRMEPARGAFVATPSVHEAQQVFAVRRTLELAMVRQFARTASAADLADLRQHMAQERGAIASGDVLGRTHWLGDFHVHMARLLGQQVLADLLGELISRCSLLTGMVQSQSAAQASADGHADLLCALEAGDSAQAVRLMAAHLAGVEASLTAACAPPTPTPDVAQALAAMPPIFFKEPPHVRV